jgi:hypothetical protein
MCAGAGKHSGQTIEELMQSVQRRNAVLDHIERICSMEKVNLGREEKVIVESTIKEKLSWGLLSSKETGLSASSAEDETK